MFLNLKNFRSQIPESSASSIHQETSPTYCRSLQQDTSPTYCRNPISHGDPATTSPSSADSSKYTVWRSGARRQSSLESGELEDVLETRRQTEQKKLNMRGGSVTPSDEDEEPKSKIRYNDLGSLEQVNILAY